MSGQRRECLLLVTGYYHGKDRNPLVSGRPLRWVRHISPAVECTGVQRRSVFNGIMLPPLQLRRSLSARFCSGPSCYRVLRVDPPSCSYNNNRFHDTNG